MTVHRSLLRVTGAILSVGAAALALAGAARADKGLNDGIYRDKDEKQHAWSIERSHLLKWNEQPYAPAGVVFHSKYLKDGKPDSLQADQAALDQLRSGGVQDLWIEPGRGLMENSVAQVQTVIDAVEQRGFRYGLRVGDRSRDPLIGFSPTVTPIRVPAQRLQPGARETFTVPTPDARRALYIMVDAPNRKTNNWVVSSGEVLVEKGQARIEAQIRKSSLLGKVPGTLLVVPEIQVQPENLGSFGDLWEGMDAYSGRLRKYLQAVKFGPGLRFVLDPFSAGDGTVGQEDLVFPASESFRNAFREWLRRRGGTPSLNTRWRTNDERIPGLEEAARLIPMWSRNDPPEGDGWLIDPVDRTYYRVIAKESRIWDDLDEFRAESLKRWMNIICTTLRQEGLNVPMLFSWGSYHPIFINSPSPAGYDGLGAQLYDAPQTLARTAAYALAQAEEADRHTWLVATRLAGPASENGNPAPITDAGTARQAWEAIRSAGFRGFYLDPEQCPNAASIVRELQSGMTADKAALDEKIRACFFPMPLATADRVTRLSNGVWWLPSGRPARLMRFGESVMAYEMENPFGDEHNIKKGTVLWSIAGKKNVTFYEEKLFPVQFYDSAGQEMKVKPKKNQLPVTLTGEPVVATGVDASMLFPFEMASDALAEFDYLLVQAEKQKLDSAGLRAIYDQAEKALAPGSASTVYRTISPYVERLRQELQPFLWVEGERSSLHNFSGVAFQAGASGGTYLKLDHATPPASGVFRALYTFDLRRDASYEFWVAGRIPGRNASPMIWQVDDEPGVPMNTVTPQGGDYATGMAWYHLGRMTLKAGRHELVLVFPDKTAAGRFQAGIDAIVISQSSFKPNGTEKPRLAVAPPTPEDGEPRKKRSERDDEKSSEEEGKRKKADQDRKKSGDDEDRKRKPAEDEDGRKGGDEDAKKKR